MAGGGKHNTCVVTAAAVKMAAMLCLGDTATEAQHWTMHGATGEQLALTGTGTLRYGAQKCIVSAVCTLTIEMASGITDVAGLGYINVAGP